MFFVISGTARRTSFFDWNVKNISKFRQILALHGTAMPDIPKEPLNQEVFEKMVGFLTAVSKKFEKDVITVKLISFIMLNESNQSYVLLT